MRHSYLRYLPYLLSLNFVAVTEVISRYACYVVMWDYHDTMIIHGSKFHLVKVSYFVPLPSGPRYVRRPSFVDSTHETSFNNSI